MRILHVATLVTPDGAYGGPVRVAVNQVRELRRRGHDATLVAAAQGYPGPLPTELDGVPCRLFPAVQLIPGTGFAGIASPRLWRYVAAQRKAADVVHVHVARDLVAMPAALLAQRGGARVVLQPHGMIDASDRRLARMFDRLLTRRVFVGARAVLALTPQEREDVLDLGTASDAVELITNGVLATSPEPTRPSVREVLFLARLHPRKRATSFVQMAAELVASHPEVRFALVGPDEGEGIAVDRAIHESRLSDSVRWEGAIGPEETEARLRACDIYVLPSVGEIVPMSVLEALSIARPVVITTSNGLAESLAEASAGVVVDESLPGLVAGVRTLLDDDELRARIAHNGYRLATERWSMSAVGDRLEMAYGTTSAVGGTAGD